MTYFIVYLAIGAIIGIAVVLAILFRKQITKLLQTLFGTIEENAAGAVSE